MKDLIALQQKLVPDVLDMMERRYMMLKSIEILQPIGRRSLAEQTKNPERLIRTELDFLHKQGFIDISAKGVRLTAEGLRIVNQLSLFMRQVSGLDMLEHQLKEQLQIEHVIVVSGDSDEAEEVKTELGKAAVTYLKQVLKQQSTIAVTGGSTMAAVADAMTPLNQNMECLFVPARGGLGEQVENQANTICVEMAKKAKGSYRLLYVPDPLSEESYHSIIEEPSVREVLHYIRHADIVIHGIGDALTMAERRKTPADEMKKIKNGNAVGEAFGYYFDKNGNMVHKVRTVGLQMEDVKQAERVIAVAGGKSKADAIQSYFNQGYSNVLITDEAAAMELLR
ncbi:transcriptional regulator [Melghiribacillus thermohalophilus]|uniref:Transcriptional regulator n=1 Tax=Melghiribacillus thermohalophilus TaxID=1324956 RepID=A0A4R3MR39_9BACI|nr:sugar-binding domain-containing protein [Melghiribacillus thermohalophilus]TCT18790.1 transcriptional regulator [Melghiribacillus thermohalophilus]